jgi:Domain of unknown function (DUF4345)
MMTGLLIHRIILGILILIPLITGTRSVLLGASGFGAQSLPNAAFLDSDIRFWGAIWLTMGLSMIWVLFHLEEETDLYRALWFAIIAGGIGRLISLWSFPDVPKSVYVFIAIELILGPILVWHQSTLAK